MTRTLGRERAFLSSTVNLSTKSLSVCGLEPWAGEGPCLKSPFVTFVRIVEAMECPLIRGNERSIHWHLVQTQIPHFSFEPVEGLVAFVDHTAFV
jgi:hypothetical protein